MSRTDAGIRRNRAIAGMRTLGAPVMIAETQKCKRNKLEKGSMKPNSLKPCSRTKTAPNAQDSGKNTYLITKKHLRVKVLIFESELCSARSDACWATCGRCRDRKRTRPLRMPRACAGNRPLIKKLRQLQTRSLWHAGATPTQGQRVNQIS